MANLAEKDKLEYRDEEKDQREEQEEVTYEDEGLFFLEKHMKVDVWPSKWLYPMP